MTALVILAVWALWLSSTVGIGRAAVAVLWPSIGPRAQVTSGIWVGLLLLSLLVLGLNFALPMSGSICHLLAWAWILIGLLLLCMWIWRQRVWVRRLGPRVLNRRNLLPLLVCAVIITSLMLVANFAAAEPMDYDAGLYRMGIINYSAEYPVIPGLANLHSRFGFNSVLGPLAAFVGNIAWEGSTFRLITGLVLCFAVADIGVRVTVPRRRTPGDYLMILGWGFTLLIILTDSGRWIPSPAQDVMALILMLVTFAFMVDLALNRKRQPWLASTVLVVASLAGAVRPLAWVLLPLLMVVVLLEGRRHPQHQPNRRMRFGGLLPAVLLSGVLVLVMLARDILLSGWLLFPLSLFPLPVDWLTDDPSGVREGITWYARAPGKTVTEAQDDGWLSPWLGSFASSPEMRAIAIMMMACVMPLVWRGGRMAWTEARPHIVIMMFPVMVLLSLWFVTAPDVRFGWAPLCAVAAVPLSLVLACNGYPRWVIHGAFLIALSLGAASNLLNGRLETRGRQLSPTSVELLGRPVTLWLGAPNGVDVVPGSLGDGTPVVYPASGENCYMVFPLCILPGSGSGIERRGDSIAEGFRRQ